MQVTTTLSLLSSLLSLGCLATDWTAANQVEDHQADHHDQNTQNDDTLPEQKKQPHIIFILTDDQGYNDIGYHNPDIKTPTLDKLAAEGVKLENYYVQPICTPSRSQLMTGRYQIHTGLQHSIIRPRQPNCLPTHMDTLPQRLKQAGYATHMVGKWHLGFYRKDCLPTRKGFDSFFGSLTGSVDYYSYGSCDGPNLCGYDLHDDEGVAWGQEGRYSTLLFTQRVRKILETHNATSRPLFLFLSLQAVHTPLQPPKSYIYPYRGMDNVARRKFAAMVSTVDESVRNITYALRKHGFYRNSIIIYSTDNGAQPFTGGSNWPLRGRKGTYWEGGMRGVAFVHSPLLRRRKRVSKALLHITDWFPTLVGLAGGNISQSHGLDGYDVWSTISEGKESPRVEILHNIDPLHRDPGPAQSPGNQALPKIKNTKVASRKVPGKALKKPKRKAHKLEFKQGSKLKSQSKKPRPFSAPLRKSKSLAHPQFKCFHNSKFKPKSKSKVKSHSRYHRHVKVRGMQYQYHNMSLSQPPPQRLSQPSTVPRSPQPQSSAQPRSPQPQPSAQPRSPQPSAQPRSPQPSAQPRSSQPQPQPQAVWDTSVQAAIRVGDWKLLTGDPGHGDWVPPQVLATLPGRWWNLERAPPAHTTFRKNVWLFNITGDPYERQDLAYQRPDVVQRLLTRLAYYNQTAVPVKFPPDDPRANPDKHGGAWVPWVGDEEDEEEDKYNGVYKKGKNRKKKKKKKKKKKCKLCKLRSFFMKLNTKMMSNRI